MNLPHYATPSIFRRLSSLLYETLLLIAVLFFADLVFLWLFGVGQSPLLRLGLQSYLLAIMAVYFCWFWMHGQTLAMKTWRIKVVNEDGGQITIGQALRRFCYAIVGWLLFGATLVWAYFDREGQFLHDRLAKTRLISVSL